MEQSYSTQWIEFAKGKTPMTWDLWASRLDDMTSLTPLGRRHVREAVRTLSNFFGETYLERCRGNDHPLFSTAYPAFNDTPGAIRNLFDLYAHIELIWKQRGRFRFQRDISSNPTFQAWQHAMIQLEVAGFALQRGYQCEFEPNLSSGNKGDVTVQTPVGELFFEAALIGTDTAFRRASRFYNRTMDLLQGLAMSHNLEISGRLKAYPENDDALWACHQELFNVTMTLAEIGTAKVFDNNLMWLRMVKGKEFKFPMISGVPTVTDTWARLAARIRDKGRQSAGAKNVWLRFDEGSGMWLGTPWANVSLKEKLQMITPMIKEALKPFDHVSGIVLTNGWAIETGQGSDRIFVEDGNVAIRRCFPQKTLRETIIICRDKSARHAVRELESWYANEPNWLYWALGYLGNPKLDELIAFQSDSPKLT